MGTITDKLVYLQDTKTAIKDSIIAKGGTIEENDSFRSYAEKISSLPTGGTAQQGTNEWKYNSEWFDRDAILASAPKPEGYTRIFYIVSNIEWETYKPTFPVLKSSYFLMSNLEEFRVENNPTNISPLVLTDNNNWKTLSDGSKINWYIYYISTSSSPVLMIDYRALYMYCEKELTTVGTYEVGRNGVPGKPLQAIETENNIPIIMDSLNYRFSKMANLRKLPPLKIIYAINNTTVDIGAAFQYSTKLEEVTLLTDENIYFTQGNMFTGCYGLKKLNFTPSHWIAAEGKSNSSFFIGCLGEMKNLPYINYSLSDVGGIKTIDFLRQATFLETIEKLDPIITTYNLYADGMYSIKKEALLKILNALPDNTGLTTRSLNLGSEVLNLLTDEDKAIALNKNWTLN